MLKKQFLLQITNDGIMMVATNAIINKQKIIC